MHHELALLSTVFFLANAKILHILLKIWVAANTSKDIIKNSFALQESKKQSSSLIKGIKNALATREVLLHYAKTWIEPPKQFFCHDAFKKI